jgi:Dyp-type peroxidase family
MSSGPFDRRVRDFIKLRRRKLFRSVRTFIRKLRRLEPRVDLTDVQGNILRGYGFRSAYYLFVHVPDGEAWVARRWLLRLCDQVMSGETWSDGRNPQHALNVAISHEGFRALGLPDHVLEWFPKEFRDGMKERSLLLGDTGASAPNKWPDGWAPEEPEPHLLLTVLAQDKQVARERAKMLLGWDPDQLDETREDPEETTPDDLGLRIPAELVLLRKKTSMKAGLFRHPHLEREDSREHFGFADGFSQPSIRGMPATPSEQGMGTLYKRGRWYGLAPGEFVLGYPGEDGIATESLVEDVIVKASPGEPAIAPESPAAPLGRNGSFMVVRKLEQHVEKFRSYLLERAKIRELPCLRHLDLPPVGSPKRPPALAERQRVLAAKIVGRWHDGTSLVLHPDKPPASEDEHARDPKVMNDFTYGIRDDEGFGCPLGAHVRRANPRDDLGWFGSLSRRHRIVRRGMPYGPRAFEAFGTQVNEQGEPEPTPDHEPGGLFDPHFFEAEAEKTKERGLMFICFQASIARQFEIIQGQWLNNGDSFWLGRQKDFLTIGPPDGATTNGADGEELPEPDPEAAGRMTVQGDPPSFLTPQPSFVTTRGGEYFFAPGLSALRALASGYWL